MIFIVPVSLEEPPEDPHPLDPELLLVGPGVGCSLPFTEATVTTLPPGLIVSPHTGPETQPGEKRALFYNEWGRKNNWIQSHIRIYESLRSL